MSNCINPQLINGYIDDLIEQSVQEAYSGSMDAPQEEMLERKLEAERWARAALAHKKAETLDKLNEVVDKIVRNKKRHNVKEETIARYRQEALELRVRMEQLDRVKI